MLNNSSRSSPNSTLLSSLLFASLQPLRRRLEAINVRQTKRAHWLCRLIPAQCPFERDVKLGQWQFHIPALCQLNPFYEQLMTLRFRALCYLSDECGEDITPYCH